MARKSDEDAAHQILQSVLQSDKKQRRLLSSSFWNHFSVGARQPSVVERIKHHMDEQGLKVTVKSGKEFGDERPDDWIIISLEDKYTVPSIEAVFPPHEWFQEMVKRDYESEREVETYFAAPLLEKLGYDYGDIVNGYPVEMFKGVQKTKTETDFVVFRGPGRERKDVLLIIETKKSNKAITEDHISQTKSYAQELMPACYIVTNGQKIDVFWFNGMMAPDERILELDKSMLEDIWGDLYKYASKAATQIRKSWMQDRIQRFKEEYEDFTDK